LPFFEETDKGQYFEIFPDGSMLKKKYEQLMRSEEGSLRDRLAAELSRLMSPGSIDVNIMAKVDGLSYTKEGNAMSTEYSDANAALRGYAKSNLSSNLRS